MNERILKRLTEAKDSMDLVKGNLPPTYREFLSMSRLERDGIYKNIEFAIQSILDICALMVKDRRLKVPDSDDDILAELQEARVMKEDVIRIIRKMKGFRNFLVHRYGALNERIAYNDIKAGLKDFATVFEEITSSSVDDQ